MRLSELLADLPNIRYRIDNDPNIGGIATHSGRVKPGDLFVALRGDAKLPDRHPFITQAIEAKAAAIVAEKDAETGSVPLIYTNDTHQTLAFLAKKFYNHPTDQLRLVGVTGTNGKSTVVKMVETILNGQGKDAIAVGNIGVPVLDIFVCHRTRPEGAARRICDRVVK
ncbi:MAG: UDP-N-acetylmuramoyl-L-alanyl-D-glutamate--2,6-diaminopimelate ligase, partial [Candidatus Latescibacterota bacterium]